MAGASVIHSHICPSLAFGNAVCHLRLRPRIQNRMGGHNAALIGDADCIEELMHIDDASRPIGNAVLMPPIETRPSWLTRRSSLSSASKGVAGSAWSSSRSAAKARDAVGLPILLHRPAHRSSAKTKEALVAFDATYGVKYERRSHA